MSRSWQRPGRLTVALNLADRKKVGIVTKREFLDGASYWARVALPAGLAKATRPRTTFRDTKSPARDVQTPRSPLRGRARTPGHRMAHRQGVPFTRDETSDVGYSLTREAATATSLLSTAATLPDTPVQTRCEPRSGAPEHHGPGPSHGRGSESPGPSSDSPSGGCPGLYALDENAGRVVTIGAEQWCSATARRQGSTVHHRSGHRDRRRHRHGLAALVAPVAEHGFHPVHPTCCITLTPRSF